jgi:hypothetical protein
MIKCIACGKTALLSTEIGNVSLCNSCASKINASTWKKRDAATAGELAAQRNAALQLATSNGFSDVAIQAIARYFDAYLNIGYVTTVNGKAGQTLRIFDNLCIIDTKTESNQQTAISMLENFFTSEEDDDDDELSESFLSSQAGNITRGLLSGRLIETGVGLVASSIIDSREKEKAAEKKEHERQRKYERIFTKMVTIGEKRVLFGLCDRVEIYTRGNSATGYLRFIPKSTPTNDIYAGAYFVFNNTTPFEGKRFRQQINSICDMLNTRIAYIHSHAAVNVSKSPTPVPAQPAPNVIPISQLQKDPFEEIRKYKALLDDGIITEDEFNKKKHELLGV